MEDTLEKPKIAKLLHKGPRYLSILEKFHETFNPEVYFEIGTRSGNSLKFAKNTAIAVDPDFRIVEEPISDRKKTFYYNQTSDSFFQNEASKVFSADKIDLAFLDGMHLFEFLLRDFANTEKYCKRNSIVFLHDCFPLNCEMTSRNEFAERTDTSFRTMWTGDVWKTLQVLGKYRKDLQITCIGAPPTGLVAISNLDPKNEILSNCYARIMDEYADLRLTESMLLEHWGTWEITNGQKFMSGQEIFKKFWL